jgi:hypothetical protein
MLQIRIGNGRYLSVSSVSHNLYYVKCDTRQAACQGGAESTDRYIPCYGKNEAISDIAGENPIV